MNKKIDKILKTWHEHFSDEEKQYSEFESSDIEYFVGCLLYNHFAFTASLDTMKTIDLSYDFLSECGDEYDDVLLQIKSIELKDERERLDFLLNFLDEVMQKYSDDELYLLKRLKYHVDGVNQRYKSKIESEKVAFEAPKPRSSNPLLR
ncbi:hypothetical protein [Sulfurimonas sp.]|uniref:hypothetical protein n=1 Tax=Sulfurimonas sp. TaxID=2022749 RepID=UPI002AB2018F|nr:hypothetical protein [Sulfurimonas sp.]